MRQPEPSPLQLRQPETLGRTAERVADVTSGPLSPAQEGLWLLHQLAPDSAAYHNVLAVRLRGQLDAGLLQRSVDEVSDRHDALRLTFRLSEDGPVQSALPGFRHPLRVLDIDDRSAARPNAEMEIISAEARRPFDLVAEPPVRVVLLRYAPEEHVLLLVLHHLISDESSMMILLGDLAAIYSAYAEGRKAEQPPPASYLDFVRWQRERLRPDAAASHIEYWRAQLEAAPAVLELPTDRPRRRAMSFRGETLSFELDRRLSDGVVRLARDRGVTVQMVLMAALQLLLARTSGQDDVAVGVPITHRTRPRFRRVVGYLANTLVMRTRFTGDPTFGELLQRVKRTAIGAYAHSELPFEGVVQALNPPRSPSVHPLFQVLLSFFNQRGGELGPPHLDGASHRMENLSVELLPAAPLGGSRFDLTVCGRHTARGLGFDIEYSSDLFDATTVERIGGHLEELLTDAARDPGRGASRLQLLTARERQSILQDWNDTDAEYPRQLCIHELFERQAERTPDAVAVRVGSACITYRQLDEDANRTARRLRELGAAPETVVAILIDHSLAAVVTMLAVLKAGAAYLVVDPCQPWTRTARGLEELGVRLMVAEDAQARTLAADRLHVLDLAGEREKIAVQTAARLERWAEPRNLAFVIATSGSTGTPKGVGIEHASALSLLSWANRTYGPEELSGVLAATSACFDCTLFELFAPLCWGGTAVVAPSALELSELPAADQVRLVSTVPSVMTALLDRAPLPESVQTVNLAGEALTPALAGRLYAQACVRRVLNLYGPSEATTYATMLAVPRECERVTIGRPLDNVRAYVVDHLLQPVPIGVSGELCLAGLGLARGYLGRPAETAERFLPDPFSAEPGRRLYRTGDRARWLASGELEYLGRLDEQVKVRGVRVEPAEVELALAAHPDVAEAVVLAEQREGGVHLLGYVRPRRVGALNAAELRAFLREQLPVSMLPEAILTVDAFPLTANGKVDRRALPRPEQDPGHPDVSRPPATPDEAVLASIWAAVLGVESVSRDDDFFELGGHSLAAMQVLARLQLALHVRLPLEVLFEATTLAALAAEIEAARRTEHPEPPLQPVPRDQPIPLSFGQQRLRFLHELLPNDPSYNMAVQLRLRGELDVAALERALNEIVRRHEVLRTSFGGEGGDLRQLVRAQLRLRLDARTLRGTLGERVAEATQLLREEAERPFDLVKGPLVRATLLRIGRGDNVISIVMHHAVSDGWSMNILFAELSELYRAYGAGRLSALTPPDLQYGDFASWQRQWLESPACEAQIAYWKSELKGAPLALHLPTDHSRAALHSAHGGTASLKIPPSTTAALRQLSREAHVTLFGTLLAGFQVLLGRYGGHTQVLVGTPVAGRSRPELQSMVGFFANTLVMRGDLSGNPSFRELLARTRRRLLGSLAHQDLPFERLVRELNLPRDAKSTPLFQAMLVLNSAVIRPQLDGIEISGFGTESSAAKFDLTLTVADSGDFLAGRLDYRQDLFEPATARRLVRHFEHLLEAATSDPDSGVQELPLMGARERERTVARYRAGAASSDTLEDLDGVVTVAADGRDVAFRSAGPGVGLYVLDGRMEPVPDGVVGTLYIGATNASGEADDGPGLAVEPCQQDPFGPSGSWLYRTTNLARRRFDGQLELVGCTSRSRR